MKTATYVAIAVALCVLMFVAVEALIPRGSVPLPAPSPAPTPAPWPPPDANPSGGWPSSETAAVNRAVDAINGRRKSKGLRPLKLDSALSRAAKVLVVPLAAGRAQPHDGFPDRVRKAGWAEQDCGIRNRGFGNTSEGNSFGGQTPEEAVLLLDASPDPNEGHRQDFEDPAFTHVGIAFAKWSSGEYRDYGGYVAVVEYGAKCD